MRYSHTTIDFASWPDTPMFSDLDGSDSFLTTTIHLKHQNLMREIDVGVTVG